MSFQVGDTVHTQSGRLYVIRTLYTGMRGQRTAGLAPPMPKPGRRRTTAPVDTLTLVRSAQLSLAFHYAAKGDREDIEDWQRDSDRRSAAYWLTKAEERNDDSRAALCLGSDRILELEAVAP